MPQKALNRQKELPGVQLKALPIPAKDSFHEVFCRCLHTEDISEVPEIFLLFLLKAMCSSEVRNQKAFQE